MYLKQSHYLSFFEVSLCFSQAITLKVTSFNHIVRMFLASATLDADVFVYNIFIFLS